MIYIADKIVPIVVYHYINDIHNNHAKERLCLAHHPRVQSLTRGSTISAHRSAKA